MTNVLAHIGQSAYNPGMQKPSANRRLLRFLTCLELFNFSLVARVHNINFPSLFQRYDISPRELFLESQQKQSTFAEGKRALGATSTFGWKQPFSLNVKAITRKIERAQRYLWSDTSDER
jgi:hypothetical protein